jgi:hypothetical protein
VVNTTTSPSGQAIRVLVPDCYNASVPMPLVIYFHGSSEDQTSVNTDAQKLPEVYDLISQGFLIATSNAHGNNWGSATGVADHQELYDYMASHYNLAGVSLWGQSMGGIAALNAKVHSTIPAKCFLGTYPVCNLRDLYDIGTYTGAIKTAYGIASDGSDYATKTAGYDPVLAGDGNFTNFRMRFYASPSDVTVPKATNSDQMKTHVDGYATEDTVVAATGVHGDQSHFKYWDYTDFFNRCR